MKKFLLIAFLIGFTSLAQAQGSRTLPANSEKQGIIRLYPNPATTVVNLDFQKSFETGYSLQIFNAILGRKMFEQNNLPEKLSINLGDFTRGLYIYQLRDRSGRMVESGRFQVAR